MKKMILALIVVGVLMILFALCCPMFIAEIHGLAWRIVIGVLGVFALSCGVWKLVREN